VTAASQSGPLLEHLFRRQAGRMVSHLVRVLGPAHVELAEESVQDAMLRALQTWPSQGVPENPEAWLFRTSRNCAIDQIRRGRLHEQKSDAIVAELTRQAPGTRWGSDLDERLDDDELRMIFLCCHPSLSRDASVALSLKTVGGFSVREIARAFLADETAIAQRLVRVKRQIRALGLTFEEPLEAEERLDAVLEVIYFIFNEGYTAHEGDSLIRTDLCVEALRLGRLIAESPLCEPRADALVALMAFQAARAEARVSATGDLILLDAQDRSLWDTRLIGLGYRHFDRSIAGDTVSRFHVEAAIAATHARSLRETDWPKILFLYDQLLEISPSPVVQLNRAVAVAKVHGAQAALQEVEPLEADPKLHHYYLLMALRGHLLLELGRRSEAADAYRAALECRCSDPERRFLEGKLRDCSV
jgi:RNA polymerase sigma-70 factor (ECF subfamily)